jgi:hypothetical protein
VRARAAHRNSIHHPSSSCSVPIHGVPNYRVAMSLKTYAEFWGTANAAVRRV